MMDTLTDRAALIAALEQAETEYQRARERRDSAREALRDDIEANGEFVYGNTRFYVGVSKRWKCRDTGETVARLLEIGGPPLLEEVLSSNPFACAKAINRLGDDSLFERIEKVDVMTGKPKSELQTMPTHMTKGGAA